jgi:hypothetical protein
VSWTPSRQTAARSTKPESKTNTRRLANHRPCTDTDGLFDEPSPELVCSGTRACTRRGAAMDPVSRLIDMRFAYARWR